MSKALAIAKQKVAQNCERQGTSIRMRSVAENASTSVAEAFSARLVAVVCQYKPFCLRMSEPSVGIGEFEGIVSHLSLPATYLSLPLPNSDPVRLVDVVAGFV